MMPSPHTADISWKDAQQEMADRVGVHHEVIDIAPQKALQGRPVHPVSRGARRRHHRRENLQAHPRGTLLMALSNKFGTVVLDHRQE